MSRFAFVTKVAVAGACTGVLSLGFLGGHASADDGVGIDVQLPVTVCGNGIGLLSPGSGTCPTPTNAPAAVDPGALVGGLLGGDPVVAASVNAPITVCGNGIGGSGACAPAAALPAPAPSGSGSGSNGLVDVGANAPITVCGNGIGLLDPATGSCTIGGSATAAPAGDGLAAVDAAAPVTVCGNAIGVLAGASSSCAQAASADSTPPTTPSTPTTTPATTPQNIVGGAGPGGSTSLITSALSPLLDGNLAVTGTAAGLIGLVGLLTLGAGRFATVLSHLPGRS